MIGDLEIPRVDYNASEKRVWSHLFPLLKAKWDSIACNQYNIGLKELMDEGLIMEDQPSQLQDVSVYLTKKTGWTIKPAAGLLSQREFFNAMAFRVFNST